MGWQRSLKILYCGLAATKAFIFNLKLFMNKQIFLTGCIWAGFILTVYGQKPVIDSSVFDKWPRVDRADISKDGNYIVYYNVMAAGGNDRVMVLQAIRQQWKASFKGVRSYHMLQDGRQLVLQNSEDSLFIMQMATKKMRHLARVSDYKVVGKGEREKLCYLSPADTQGLNKLTLYSTSSNKQWGEDSVADHWFSGGGNVLVIKKKTKGGLHSSYTWEWHNLDNGAVGKIWEGDAILNYSMDGVGRQLTFTTQLPDSGKYGLWYYHEGMASADPRVVDGSVGIDSNLQLDIAPIIFSRDGKRVFFSLAEKNARKPSSAGVQLDIWNYRDPLLQEAQLRNVGDKVSRIGWMSIATGLAQQLEKNGTHLYGLGNLEDCNGQVLLTNAGGDDMWWRGKERAIICLSSLEEEKGTLSGDVGPIKNWINPGRIQLSPAGKYVLYVDPKSGNFCSYEIADKQTHNITESLKSADGTIKGGDFFVAGWLPDEQAVLLYDNWDIWRVDPGGVEAPVNLTQGYGRLHHIRLRLRDEEMRNGIRGGILDLSPNRQLLLTAFDTATKYSGFYRLWPGKGEPPALVTMGPYRYISARKAANANAWLVLRESAVEAPNYYFTNDWVNFLAVTDVAPQKHYNWLTAELVTWPLPDGQLCQGMLFKPEDLDVHKKYPLLVHYYEAFSDRLYHYWQPAATMDEINIPYFVSRGYVVFVPDIHYRMGYSGESALAAILSGARHLSKFPWIDSTRMGLQGHSFGGYETNYIVTHTNLFAAAAEGAGVSDMISDCNGIAGGGESNQAIFEAGQYRMGASLWENPDIYIQGSPIFNADKVTTPLLMLHNKLDRLVPWLQGVEFFSALRRCGKKAWMLQYDRGEHFVQPGADALDYTIRIEQFFNHYLKGAPPPKWMTEGVPAWKKGLETGYELDTSGKVP
jgi:dienelactone hydrolase